MIGSRAFCGCHSFVFFHPVRGDVDWRERVSRLCAARSVILPEALTTIGKAAFTECKSMVSVDVPGGVTTVKDATFGECTSLTRATFCEGVTAIGNAVFHDCNSLSQVCLREHPNNWPGSLLHVQLACFDHHSRRGPED